MATLYVQIGQADDALTVLESDPNSESQRGGEEVMDTSQVESLTDRGEAAEGDAVKETASPVCV